MQVVYLLTKRMKIKEPILEITVKLVVRLGVLRQHFPRNLYEELYRNSLLELGRPSSGPKPRFEVEGPVGSQSIETTFDENCCSLWVTVRFKSFFYTLLSPKTVGQREDIKSQLSGVRLLGSRLLPEIVM